MMIVFVTDIYHLVKEIFPSNSCVKQLNMYAMIFFVILYH